MRTVAARINGQDYSAQVADHTTLLSFLRDTLGLTGTKEGCGAGECGACTVIVNGLAVNACLVLAAEADGADIMTIEGQTQNGVLSKLQRAFIEHNGFQCGFCTPGMIMSAQALLNRNPHPNRQQIIEAIEGNLCRCTGYESVIAAIAAAAGDGHA